MLLFCFETGSRYATLSGLKRSLLVLLPLSAMHFVEAHVPGREVRVGSVLESACGSSEDQVSIPTPTWWLPTMCASVLGILCPL